MDHELVLSRLESIRSFIKVLRRVRVLDSKINMFWIFLYVGKPTNKQKQLVEVIKTRSA